MTVAEGAPRLLYPKLPFWNTVILSYSTYFMNFVDALRASWLWLIAVAVVTGVANWQQWSWMGQAFADASHGAGINISKPAEMVILIQFSNIVVLLAGVSIAVAWHRLVIVGEEPGFSGTNVTTKPLWRYIAVGLAIGLITFLPTAVILFSTAYYLSPIKAGATLPSGLSLLILLTVALAVTGAVAAVRLSLLLPARAIGDTSLTFKQSWNRSRGNFWRLNWGIAATTAPPLLIMWIAFLLANGFPVPAAVISQDFVARMTAASVIFNVYYLLITPIGIGFLSHAYRHFFHGALEPAE